MTEKSTPEKDEAAKADTASIEMRSYAARLWLSISKNALLLGLFALICTGLIATTFIGTEDEIAMQQRAARLKALLEIIPTDRHNNDMLQDNIEIFENALGHREPQPLFLARNDGKPVALIYPATARDGYSGDIRYIVGINLADDTVAGVRVLKHRETPGLGDGIEVRKSNWIKSFNGKSLGQPSIDQWSVKKDGGVFDGFTGATITPRALAKSVAQTLQHHQQYGKGYLKRLIQNAHNLQSTAAVKTASN
ncbi:electron transport complex subunit RsxG [Pseudomonadales bacterium]|jgi:electron transport complex protein RnfG|nr:electron transport complex subunit RsxG [Pseudomonadales bacterium]MDB4451073.1 electron transport complex subunit RsxG [Pseudomonadales bacterium]MDB4453078.1 electron transport complex subunit RsxG [bacterium]MDB4528335.1 electron transport complex subunit RsxG [Pseudomonadales bacterium]